MSTKYRGKLLRWGTVLLALVLFCVFLLAVTVKADSGEVFCVTSAGGVYAACDQVFTTIQAAVDAAIDGEQIKIAAGVYNDLHLQHGITQVVYLTKTLTLAGGYTTTNNFADPPDPAVNVSILDAGGLGRGLVISGTISPQISGLHITGGDASGLGGGGWGGFDAGGGIYVREAAPSISDCVVYGNLASATGVGQGGGVFLACSSATLENNTIYENQASTADWARGGGVFLYHSAALIQHNTIFSNTASTAGNGYGGGVDLGSTSPATLNGNHIHHNTASTGERGWGGGVSLAYSDNALLEYNLIEHNLASAQNDGYGGGVRLYRSDATLHANYLLENHGSFSSRGYGGGVCSVESDVVLSANHLQGNIASVEANGCGGGLSLSRSPAELDANLIISNTATLVSAHSLGGGIYVLYSEPLLLTNNIVADNHARGAGAGLYIEGGASSPSASSGYHNTVANNQGIGQGLYVAPYVTLALTNTILSGHSSVGITVTVGSTVTLEATLWHSNGLDVGGVVSNTGNLYGDPLFWNPTLWDYHLGGGSAAINAGVVSPILVDIDGEERTGAPDLGADEFYNRIYLPLVIR